MAAVIRRGARASNTTAPPAPTGIDLIVTNIAWTPASPVSGDQVIFRATVQNIGDTATPAGTILDVVFRVDAGTPSEAGTWSDTYTTSLAPGASAVLTANSGPSGLAYWSATIGTHTVNADVNSIDRITESNGTNNTLDTTITVAAGSGAPSLPANAVVGTPASELVWWGDGNAVYLSQATYQTWWDRGWHGFRFGTNQLYGHGQSDLNFIPSNSAGLGAIYSWQQQLEPSGSNRAALARAVGYKIWNGIYFREVPFSSNLPPVDWWSDAACSSLFNVLEQWQQAGVYLGIGNSIDTEINGNGWLATGFQGDTHTAAQNRVKAEQRGYEAGLKIWGTDPAAVLVWYDILFPGAWNNKIGQVINGQPFPDDSRLQVWMFAGMLRAMIAVGATGKIRIADFSFYRLATNYAPGAVQRAAYQLNTMGARAWLSQNLSAAVWAGGYRLFEIEGFTWHGTDGNNFPNVTQPSDATWVTMTNDARNYGEGDTRFEYTGPQEGWPGGYSNVLYSNATAVTGTQAAALTTAVSTSLPSLTGAGGTGNPTAVRSGSNVTIGGRAAHLFGIYGVEVHRGSTWDPNNQTPSLVGVCRMTFVENGGNYTSNYDNAYQLLTLITTDNGWAGETYAVLKVTSIRRDVRYLSVTIT